MRLRRLSVLLLSVVAACPAAGPAPGSSVLARVGAEQVTVDDWEQRYRRAQRDLGELPVLSQPALMALKRRLLVELVDERLLLQEAAREGLSVTPAAIAAERDRLRHEMGDREWRRLLLAHYVDERAWEAALGNRMLIDALIASRLERAGPVSDAEVRQRFEAEQDRFTRPASVRVQQIVVDELATAERLRGELRRGADFAALAREHSLGPESARGGDMGFIGEGDLPASFAPAFDLQAGKTSDVIHTEYGYHIFRAAERRDAYARSLTDVADGLRAELEAERKQDMRAALLADLRQRTPVVIEEETWKRLLEPR